MARMARGATGAAKGDDGERAGPEAGHVHRDGPYEPSRRSGCAQRRTSGGPRLWRRLPEPDGATPPAGRPARGRAPSGRSAGWGRLRGLPRQTAATSRPGASMVIRHPPDQRQDTPQHIPAPRGRDHGNLCRSPPIASYRHRRRGMAARHFSYLPALHELAAEATTFPDQNLFDKVALMAIIVS